MESTASMTADRWVAPAPPLVEVNFNAVDPDGRLRVLIERLPAAREDQLLFIRDSEAEVQGRGRVGRVDRNAGLLYVDVLGESLTDLPTEPASIIRWVLRATQGTPIAGSAREVTQSVVAAWG